MAEQFDLVPRANFITRAFKLDDLEVVPNGDGRTVRAYAAVFNTEAEIRDHEGHYNEVIHPNAFDSAIRAAKNGDAWRVGVFYNHGLTIHGTPSERASMPIGSPVSITTDNVGVLTETRYNKTPQADEILEAIRNGDITGQSFTGPIRKSDPTLSRAERRRGGHMPVDGKLRTVTRMELGLIEYGPTPMPAYQTAAILGVRSLVQQELRAMLDARNSTTDPGEDQVEGLDESDEAAEISARNASAHSSESSPLRTRIRAANLARGITKCP